MFGHAWPNIGPGRSRWHPLHDRSLLVQEEAGIHRICSSRNVMHARIFPGWCKGFVSMKSMPDKLCALVGRGVKPGRQVGGRHRIVCTQQAVSTRVAHKNHGIRAHPFAVGFLFRLLPRRLRGCFFCVHLWFSLVAKPTVCTR